MTGFWLFMLVMDLLIPCIMIVFGMLFLRGVPRQINGFFGYRSGMSMKNQETWDFAHRYCGRLWVRSGWMLLPLSVIPLLFVLGRGKETIAVIGLVVCLVQMVPLIGSVFRTETALEKAFDQSGRPKQP